MMKSGIRIIAVDDSRFKRGDRGVLVVGVVGRGDVIEGILSCRVAADGADSTRNIIGMISSSRFKQQIRLVVTNGTTVAGLNVIDIKEVHSRLGMPVMAITRKRPHPDMLKASIRSMRPEAYAEKIAIIDGISKSAELSRVGGMYVQHIGIGKALMSGYAGSSIALLRLAHMIASGVSGGESKGRI
jgi:hypothetical protein